MKTKLHLALLVLSLSVACCTKEPQEINYVVFSGFVKNPYVDSLKLYDKNYKAIKTIHLNSDKKFRDTLFIPDGYYYIVDFKTSTKLLFLKKSFNLSAHIDSNDEDFSITFQGNGSNENNYLQKKTEFDKTFGQVEKSEYFMALNEERFLKLSDSIYTEKINYLNLDLNLDNDFKDYESFTIKQENSQLINRYSKWRGEFIGDKRLM